MLSEGISTLDDLNVKGKVVFVRCDINCPLDQDKRIKDTTRIRRSIPTLKELFEEGAKVVIFAHQGDPLDYQNFISLEEHRDYLERFLKKKVEFIEDIAGPIAQEKIKKLKEGEILLLENIRLYTEETIIFEEEVKLTAQEQCKTYLITKLSPLADLYLCDAFACVHRSEPSLVAFPRILPSAVGRLFEEELTALSKVRTFPQKPCLYLLGGAKILDAFRMMDHVLKDNCADRILTFGLVGNVMLKAKGYDLGKPSEELLKRKNLLLYVDKAKQILKIYGQKVSYPQDVAIDDNGRRKEITISSLPADGLILDIGEETISEYSYEIGKAKTIFMNGPAGMYEREGFYLGTEKIWKEVGNSSAFSVIGGGDTIAAAGKFGIKGKICHISTAGGGLIRFLAGETLPVMEALKKGRKGGFKEHLS
jgi:phosphoglycerate kinase